MAPMIKRMKLGDVAVDEITGFRGVVVCVSTWIHGCRRITVQPQEVGKDGKPIEPVTFDEPQLRLVKPRAVNSTHETGGPRPEPVRR